MLESPPVAEGSRWECALEWCRFSFDPNRSEQKHVHKSSDQRQWLRRWFSLVSWLQCSVPTCEYVCCPISSTPCLSAVDKPKLSPRRVFAIHSEEDICHLFTKLACARGPGWAGCATELPSPPPGSGALVVVDCLDSVCLVLPLWNCCDPSGALFRLKGLGPTGWTKKLVLAWWWALFPGGLCAALPAPASWLAPACRWNALPLCRVPCATCYRRVVNRSEYEKRCRVGVLVRRIAFAWRSGARLELSRKLAAVRSLEPVLPRERMKKTFVAWRQATKLRRYAREWETKKFACLLASFDQNTKDFGPAQGITRRVRLDRWKRYHAASDFDPTLDLAVSWAEIQYPTNLVVLFDDVSCIPLSELQEFGLVISNKNTDVFFSSAYDRAQAETTVNPDDLLDMDAFSLKPTESAKRKFPSNDSRARRKLTKRELEQNLADFLFG